MIQTADAEASAKLARAMFKLSLPGAVQQVVAETTLDAAGLATAGPLAGKTAIDGKPTAYACLGPQCSLPRDGAGCAAGAAARAAQEYG